MPSSLPPLGSRFVSQFKGHERRIRTLENRVSVVLPDNSIPGTPSFLTPLTSFYQSTSDGSTKAQITLTWSQPSNTDGSTVLDAAYYEIQYRPSTTFTAQPTHAQIAASATNTHAALNSGGYTHVSMPGAVAPASSSDGDWHPITIPWNQNSLTIKELTPGVTYEIRIRFADTSTPTNLSAWSSSALVTAAADSLAPSQPAAPSVASSLIAVQVTHTLGKVGGGTYNLEGDLHHFEVHGSYEPTFLPTAATLLGKMIANAGMLTAQIPAVASFGVSSTVGVYVKVIAVDISGNKSLASAAASATATLIDDEHISNLSVSKLTAGTITAAILLAGSIKTSSSGARVELDSMGVRLYDVDGNDVVNMSSADGSVLVVGTIRTNRLTDFSPSVALDPFYVAPGAGSYPTVVLADGFNGGLGFIGPARLNATSYGVGGVGGTQTGLNSGPSVTGASFNQSTSLMRPDGWITKFNDQAGGKKGGFVSGDVIGAHLATTDSSGVQKSGLDLFSDGTVLLLSNVFAGAGLQVDGSGNTSLSSGASTSLTLGANNYASSMIIFNDGAFVWAGKFQNFIAQASNTALSTGQNAQVANNVTITWGGTMISTMVPICTMQNGSGGSFACVTANNSTNFTITANVSASQNFNWWAYRV
jgi:hypothetical protein